jgi:hypothetical protein
MQFHADGEIQKKVHGRIINPGLQEFLGGLKEIDLHYDTHWHGIKKIKKRDGPDAVLEYMRGLRQGNPEDEALLVSFHYGEGFVIYTTFHNSKQISDIELRLLQYLVLRPLMESKTFESNTIIVQNAFTPTKEVVGSLQVGQESQIYTFPTNKECDLKFIFNWKGKATVKASIFDPTGKSIVDANIRTSPKIFDISKAMTGKWTFKLKIVDAPLTNFPFVINVGVKDALLKQLGDEEIPQSSEITPEFDSQLITMEILHPIRKIIGQIELKKGKKYEIGRNQIPQEIQERTSVSSHHVILQLIDENQVLIQDVSSYGTGAASFTQGSFETQPLIKDIPVAFSLPIILNFANVIIIHLF